MNLSNKETSHSDILPLKKVYLKSIAQGFLNQENVSAQWKSLNYLGCPDYKDALVEYANFVNILRSSGAEVQFFEEDKHVTMDSIYCRDASIATDQGMILCNMGKIDRKGEPAAQRLIFEKNNIKIIGEITSPGTMEGGDVAWLDDKTLAVGHGYRSNMDGFKQLQALLAPLGIECIHVHLPHYKGMNDVFHLMSIFSPVDDDLAVVYSPLMPVMFRNMLINRGYQLIEVPDSEFESMGCNVLALSPRNCVLVDGNPITQLALEAANCNVHTYKGRNISVLGGGGPTCLTRPISR